MSVKTYSLKKDGEKQVSDHFKVSVEYLTLIFMPLFALLVAFSIWNVRRH